MKKNEPLKKLILQVLDEPELLPGAYSRFAKIFSEHSRSNVSKASVCNWLNRDGLPSTKIGFAQTLSEKYAKKQSQIITAKMFRPDLHK